MKKAMVSEVKQGAMETATVRSEQEPARNRARERTKTEKKLLKTKTKTEGRKQKAMAMAMAMAMAKDPWPHTVARNTNFILSENEEESAEYAIIINNWRILINN
jgi:hypothetical protein